MSKSPHITIITVTYNCAHLLEKTIDSILIQDFNDYEYLVIDGQSTDGTLDVIRKNQQHITYWCSEKDKGIYDAMNKGIKKATGKWIIFLNAGDTFANNNVLTKVSSYTYHTDYDIVYGNILVRRNNQLVERKALPPRNKQRMFFCHQSAFVKTDILKQMPFDIQFKMSADFHFFKRCLLMGHKFLHVDEPFAIFDLTGVSNTNRLKGLYDNVKVIQKTDKGLDKIKFLSKLYFVIGWIHLRNLFKR